jgi:hypothetical protein
MKLKNRNDALAHNKIEHHSKLCTQKPYACRENIAMHHPSKMKPQGNKMNHGSL